MKKIVVISLGGSVIIPDKVDLMFLHRFKRVLKKFYKTHKFVVVCGGGTIARQYIAILKKMHSMTKKNLSIAGIRATRMNAELLMQMFGKEANAKLPKTMKEVKDDIKKNKVVFCGALRYAPDETTDGTAAKLAHYFDTKLINITNVNGLYDANPKNNKKAKLIANMEWEDFETIAQKIKYKPGQHFVLDQKAAARICKHKITTYIIGPSTTNLENLLTKKQFIGTTIAG